jgi:hypothetical protein
MAEALSRLIPNADSCMISVIRHRQVKHPRKASLIYVHMPGFVEQGRELAVTVGRTGQRSNRLTYGPICEINDLKQILRN